MSRLERMTDIVRGGGQEPTPMTAPPAAYFIADVLDWVPKADIASMEHPIFALRAGDRRVLTYERAGAKVTVKAGPDGRATIHDQDLWIYCISQLVEAQNRGREDLRRTVRFRAHDFLATTQRQTSGEAYTLLSAALARLSGTRIETNIETGGQRERAGFGLLDAWRVIERDVDGRMVAVEVVLPDWLYRSIVASRVLTLSPAYFHIRSPLARRVYEIARKHCGHQRRWRVSLDVLREKSGSASRPKEFHRLMQQLARRNNLPDYRMVLVEQGAVVFFSRSTAGKMAQLKELVDGTLKPAGRCGLAAFATMDGVHAATEGDVLSAEYTVVPGRDLHRIQRAGRPEPIPTTDGVHAVVDNFRRPVD